MLSPYLVHSYGLIPNFILILIPILTISINNVEIDCDLNAAACYMCKMDHNLFSLLKNQHSFAKNRWNKGSEGTHH